MRSFAWITVAGLALAPAWASAREVAAPVKAKPAEACTGDFGTSIFFDDSPKDASARAAKEQKLVLVLHISGHFEDPKLT